MKVLYAKNQFKGLGGSYLESPDSFGNFYPYGFNDIALDERRNDVLASSFDRETLSQILYSGNSSLGASDKTLENCRRVNDHLSTVVVTGQQAGLATGPVYTLYKAARAITLAKELEEKWGTPVVPVFWVASEDHDFDEVSELWLQFSGKVSKYSVSKTDDLKKSIGNHTLDKNEEALLRQIMESCGDDVFSNQLSSILESTFILGEDYAKWFARIMANLFGDHGLVLIDPMWQGIRQLQSQFFKEAFERNEDIEARFRQQSEAVRESGHQSAIELMEGHSCLFKYVDGERLPILRSEDGTFEVDTKNGMQRFTLNEMLEIVVADPQAFSTNVVLRPIVQEVILPNIAYVGGPGEITYHAQLTRVYDLFARKMPILLPRLQLTVIDKTVEETARQYGFGVDECFEKSQLQIENAFLKQMDDLKLDDRFALFRSSFDDIYKELVDGLGVLHDEMGDLINKNRGMLNGQVDYLEEKAKSHHRRRFKEDLKRIAAAFGTVRPNGSLQERVVNFSSIYSKSGKAFIDTLVGIPSGEMRHLIVCLDSEEA